MATRTYRLLYDDPPTPELPQFDRGSSSTSDFSPTTIPAEHSLPRLITQDTELCNGVVRFAQQHLDAISRQPPEWLINKRFGVSGDMEDNGVGNEIRVGDLCVLAARYSRYFVSQAENIDASRLVMASCDEIGGVRPDRMCQRDQITRLIIENKGQSAFDSHRNGIEQLATADNGRGTELICSLPETGSRSIIFKLGKHMIDTNCPWGLIFGGGSFFLLFLNSLQQGGQMYHQLLVSPAQETFGEAPSHNVVQLYIAVHLGSHRESFRKFYKPSKPTIRTPYTPLRRDPRRKQPTQQQKRSLSGAQQPPPRRSPRFQQTVLQQKTCTMSWPLSILPDRKIRMENWDSSVKEHETQKQPFELFLFDQLGSGKDGVVCEGALCRENECRPCAVKIIRDDFAAFRTEAEVYATLSDTAHTPSLYGAFHGIYQDRQVGIIVMDLLDSTFKRAEDMTSDQKQQALECLREVHRGGFCRVDPSPQNLGVKDGRVVIFDFAHARRCSPDHDEEHYEITNLNRVLFGRGSS